MAGPRATPPESVGDDPARVARGWSDYAFSWTPETFRPLSREDVRYLGDEWSSEDTDATGGTTYGAPLGPGESFVDYLRKKLIDPFVPSPCGEALEIGPGGGRATAILLDRVDRLHLLDSRPMFRHVRRRFGASEKLVFHEMDGRTLPHLPPASLDLVFSFDTFVHFEPRLVFAYLGQAARLLRPGGRGIIHYADVLTPAGWRQFEHDLRENPDSRRTFGAFGVMCPPLMRRFLEKLDLTLVAEPDVIPRDAIAVFDRPSRSSS